MAVLLPVSARAEIVLTDIAGRTVTLDRPAERLVIDDGRFLVALSLISPDPVGLLAGWPRDVNRIGEQTYERYRERFPAIDDVPQVSSSAGTFALEPVLAAAPDAAVFSLGAGPSEDAARRLEEAGIAVVFIDFFSHPFENLEPSLRILASLVGADAEPFLAFRRERMDRIAERVAGLAEADRPTVFLEAHAGISGECCNSPGKGNIGDYIDFVGGHNIGADVLPGPFGRLNLEYVIDRDPDIYIATGGPHLEATGGLVVGQGYTPERARASLAAVAARPGIAELSAVAAGRVHGLSHQLLNSPLDILAIEVLARWIHPELFGPGMSGPVTLGDVDPDGTLAELNDRFLAVPLDGAYWIDLP